MSLYQRIRKISGKKRKSPKPDILLTLDKMGWENAQERQKVEGWDDWHTAEQTGYWPK